LPRAAQLQRLLEAILRAERRDDEQRPAEPRHPARRHGGPPAPMATAACSTPARTTRWRSAATSEALQVAPSGKRTDSRSTTARSPSPTWTRGSSEERKLLPARLSPT